MPTQKNRCNRSGSFLLCFCAIAIGAIRLWILRIHLLRLHGYCYSDKTAIAMGAMRLKIVRIHLLRCLGYEGAEETISAALPVSAVLVGSSSP